MQDKVVKKEIRFSWHIPKTDGGREDYHYVREDVTYESGKIEPKTYLVANFKRPIFVTTPTYRNHKEKKEFEHKERLTMQMTTQSDLNMTTARLLGQPHLARQIDEVKSSPYVYGYDVTSTSLIKYTSLKKNDFVQSLYTVAAFDIETNPNTDEILMASIVMGKKAYVSLLRKFVKYIPDTQRRVKEMSDKLLVNHKDLEITVALHDNEVDMLKDVFRVANEWQPVFLAIWNMDFDITKILNCLKKYDINPIDVFCDQKIPRYTRMCRYKRGQSKKVTQSGAVKPINPSLQWHTLICTSPFYVIDAMCTYRQLRMAKQEEPSYSLDSILQKELGTRKLRFEQAEEYSGVKWHLFMQEQYPIEYIVYNIYDCLGILELEEKNKDMSSVLPAFAGITDFQKFNSQIKKITDALFLFGLEKDMITGTVGSIPKEMEDVVDGVDSEEDDDTEEEEFNEDDPNNYKTLGLKGWIQLLPQNLLVQDGLRCLEEYPDVVTNLRGLTSDLDSISSYPSCLQAGNVSKATCVNEVIDIKGVSEEDFREQNLVLCLGATNMLDYFHVMFDMPSIDQIDAALDNL